MLGRLVHRADFERLLATSPRWRSAHFAIHHVTDGAMHSELAPMQPEDQKLSTEPFDIRPVPVDKMTRVCLGVAVPKRHARRAVTRNLIRRLVKVVFTRHLAEVPAGHWLVRLRSPFAAREFVSANSQVFARAVRSELEKLVGAITGPGAVGGAR